MTTSPSTTPTRVPGRLVVGPTDLNSAFPYGGAELGLAQHCRLEKTERRSPSFRAEELAGDAFDGLYLGEDWFATAFLTQWTTDTLSASSHEIAAGSGAVPVVSYPSTTKAPSLLSARGVKLLFVPEYVVLGGADKTSAEALSWILYNAVPLLEEPIEFTGFRSARLFVAWEAYPDNTGRVGRLCSFADMSL